MTGPAMNTNLVYKFTGTMPQTQNFGVISDSETLNQAIQDNYVANRINASKDANPIATLGVTGALWYAIAQAMDKFNAHCDKPYEQTIFGKLGNWGDKISVKQTNHLSNGTPTYSSPTAARLRMLSFFSFVEHIITYK